MNQKNKVQLMTVSALLCAIGIMIPMFAPKIMIEPASFTLASHVPIIIAMFLSPYAAVSVALITSFGFLLSGFPLVVVLRALSHLVFATIGAFMLKKNGNLLNTPKSATLFALVISVIHGVMEVGVVTFFYWGSQMGTAYYEKGYLLTVIGLVGLGTIIHSMIDFGIAMFVWSPLQNVITFPVSVKKSRKQKIRIQ